MKDTPKKQSAEPVTAYSDTNHQATSDSRNTPSTQKQVTPDSKWNFYTKNWLLIVILIAASTKFYRLDRPDEVVFDEVHFGKFASYYLRRENYFDVHPPIGKMLFALVGYLFGYDGSFKFLNIGDRYFETTAPYVDMRGLSALCGTLTVIVVYLMLIEMKFSLPIALLGTCMVVFDNALTTQSRYILLDLPLIFFIIMACFSWVKFRSFTQTPFTLNWWIWLALTGVFIGMATGVKLIGLFITIVIGLCTIRDLWEVINVKKTKRIETAFSHIFARVLCLIVLPACVFLFGYVLHFKVLNSCGDGDKHMSTEFLYTLKGNNITNHTRAVYYDSIIKIKSKADKSYLHSHKHFYPEQYPGGRMSSGGQQVTGYGHKDENNDWVILPSLSNSSDADQNSTKTLVKNGDIIRLKHIITDKYLISSDIPTPVTGANQEVSAIAIENATDEKYPQTLWKIEMRKGQEELYSKITSFKLIHVASGCSLYMSTKEKLPEWGYKQMEVGAGFLEDQRIWWSVDKVFTENSSNSSAEQDNQKAVEFLNKQVPGFFAKFAEYFVVQLVENNKLVEEGPPETSPYKWPVLVHGQPFWGSKDGTQRTYLLGNPFAWYIAFISVIGFVILTVIDVFALRRGLRFLNEQQRNFLYEKGGYFLLCYLFHYIPFYIMGRVLYFHHYLPSYLFSTLIFATFYQILALKYQILNSKVVIGVICGIIIGFFTAFSCLCYATVQNPEYLKSLKWLPRWNW